jgi:hypothetical protein
VGENRIRHDDSPWIHDPKRIERAKIALVVSLHSRGKDELVRMLMNWLGQTEIEDFCRTFLEPEEIDRIEADD